MGATWIIFFTPYIRKALFIGGALLVAGLLLWGWGESRYHAGKSAGASQERIAWEAQRAIDLAKQAVQKAADQARIDQIEAEYQTLQEQLNQERAEAALEEATRKDNKSDEIAIPRSLSRALNEVGR